jgi:hypothetical protein
LRHDIRARGEQARAGKSCAAWSVNARANFQPAFCTAGEERALTIM